MDGGETDVTQSFELPNDIFIDTLAHGLSPRRQQTRTRTLRELRALAREGNPFPLCAYQWPQMVIRRDSERSEQLLEWFEGSPDDPDNPCLMLEKWQRWFLRDLFGQQTGELFFKGATGVGKSAVMAIGANLLFDAMPVLRCSLTSETFNHVKKVLYREVKKWRRKMVDPKGARVTTVEIHGDNESYIQCLNPDPHGEGEAFSGGHEGEGWSVYFFDEASAVPQNAYENCLKNARKVIAAANPRTNRGWFRNAYTAMRNGGSRDDQLDAENTSGYCMGKKGRRLCFTVGGMDVTNVSRGLLKSPVSPLEGITIGGRRYEPGELIEDADFKLVEAVVPGQMDLSQYQEIIYTSESDWQVECFAHARFPREDPSRQVIAGSWLPRHTQASASRVTCFGLDVGYSLDGDPSVLSAGGSAGCVKIHRYRIRNTPDHAAHIMKIARDEYGIELRDGSNPVCIDYGGGYGGGVGDLLREQGVFIIEFIPNGTPLYRKGIYANQRAESWLLLAERLNPEGSWKSMSWAMPDDQQLLEELVAPQKLYKKGGAVVAIEAKDDIRERIGRSPDSADSIALLFYAVFQRYKMLETFNKKIIRRGETLSKPEDALEEDRDGYDLLSPKAKEIFKAKEEAKSKEQESFVLVPKMTTEEPENEALDLLRQLADEYRDRSKSNPSQTPKKDRWKKYFADENW